jgi:hypothetical protein
MWKDSAMSAQTSRAGFALALLGWLAITFTAAAMGGFFLPALSCGEA